jgi:hypothetical protein
MKKTLVIPRLIKMRFYRYCLSYFPRPVIPSDKPITVVIPLAVKDIYRAGVSVHSIRKHVKHPIQNIIIVGQDHDDIREFCRRDNLIYINENDILPAVAIASKSNSYQGVKASNWVRQQLIKLTVFNYIDAENILIQDSDTYYVHDVVYFSGERQILFVADEFTHKYESMMLSFLGPIKRYHRSFVTHSMLLQRKFCKSLNDKVLENCGMSLVDAIVAKIERANAGELSEFEIYGNFVYSFHKEAYETRYWYNRKIPPATRLPLEILEARFWNMNTLSAHEH